MWLVVGLGNPGTEYSRTRHNVGFMVVQTLARELGVQVRKKKYRSKIAMAQISGEKVILALPQTYMNMSGLAVKDLLNGFKLLPANMVVIYDDLDLNFGEIRIRPQGSAGTHKGMKSIVQEINTTVFPRVRVGIGPKAEAQGAADFVLSEFSAEEMSALKPVIEKASRAVQMIVNGDIQKAMNEFNRKKV
ncbi:MAG: aminoacyl-tRNA hydrolase [Candidatus Aminicenantes bacterium]|nr:aminoacyl-tRNA hydrolase [Candidatus Aminicenantes bacterium]